MQLAIQESIPDVQTLVDWYIEELAELLDGKIQMFDWRNGEHKHFLYAIIELESNIVHNKNIDLDTFDLLMRLKLEKRFPKRIFIYVFDWKRSVAFLNIHHAWKKLQRQFGEFTRNDYMIVIATSFFARGEQISKILSRDNIYLVTTSEILSMFRMKRIWIGGGVR